MFIVLERGKRSRMNKVIAYVGLGSNLESPSRQIDQAIQSLKSLPQIHFITASRHYQSKPVGPQDQPDFINAVVKLETSLTPQELLAACQKIEIQQGRVRTQKRGPRTIDLDILLYGDHVINTEDLIVPHPEMMHRDFVLKPLRQIAPELKLFCE